MPPLDIARLCRPVALNLDSSRDGQRRQVLVPARRSRPVWRACKSVLDVGKRRYRRVRGKVVVHTVQSLFLTLLFASMTVAVLSTPLNSGTTPGLMKSRRLALQISAFFGNPIHPTAFEYPTGARRAIKLPLSTSLIIVNYYRRQISLFCHPRRARLAATRSTRSIR